jgi:hypothetical protein
MIFLKKHITDHGFILAMCDEELIGKVLKEGKLLIDLEKYASFYRGVLVSEAQAYNAIKDEEVYTANVVGDRAVKVLIKKGMATKEDVKKIGKVPFVQIFKLDVF